MNKSDILTLFDYNDWANGRIAAVAERVSDEQFLAPANVSHGNLRDTLVHMLSADWVWRLRCQEGVSPESLLSLDEFSNFAAVRDRWQKETAALRSYIEGLTDEDLTQTIHYSSTSGRPYSDTLWHILVHLPITAPSTAAKRPSSSPTTATPRGTSTSSSFSGARTGGWSLVAGRWWLPGGRRLLAVTLYSISRLYLYLSSLSLYS
jgi:uncharacterized damage-inducible protein DinB